jgi:hypothetical protein
VDIVRQRKRNQRRPPEPREEFSFLFNRLSKINL